MKFTPHTESLVNFSCAYTTISINSRFTLTNDTTLQSFQVYLCQNITLNLRSTPKPSSSSKPTNRVKPVQPQCH